MPRARYVIGALALCASSCSGEQPIDAFVVRPRDAAAAPSDAGLATVSDAGPGRPDGGAVLPGADAELFVPFAGAEVTHAFEVEAELGQLDVALSVDTTRSMQNAIDNLQDDLRRVLISGLRTRVPMVSFAVTSFEDFPLPPFGGAATTAVRADAPFRLLTGVTSDEGAVTNAVARLDRPLGRGGDLPEASAEALFQIATGMGYAHDRQTLIAAYDGVALEGGGELGGVGFRPNALRVVVHVTDAAAHAPEDYAEHFPGTHSLEQAAQALNDIGARVVGIVSRNCEPEDCDDPLGNYATARRHVEQLAVATGGVTSGDDGCRTGLGATPMPLREEVCPLVFDVDARGNGLSKQLVDAVVGLIDRLSFDEVSASVKADPLGFVQRIEAVAGGAQGPPALADYLPRGAPDGLPETFVGVPRGSKLRFIVHLRNDRIAPTDREQRFRLTVRVVGDGLLLHEQTLRIVVPALADSPPPAVVTDAGLDTGMPAADDAGG